MSKGFNDLIAKVNTCGVKKVAVAVAQDARVLEAVRAAKERNIAEAILVGDQVKIEEVAAGINMDLSGYEIIHVEDTYEAALKAVSLVSEGKADMYMKGLVDTKSFLKSILDKEVGLRTGRPLSHVAVFEVKGVDHLLFLTDVAFMTYPTLEDKANIIANTVEAAELTKMNEEGKITGCIVDGPLSLDLAIDPEAAAHKGAQGRKIVGDADILLFPDIHAGNLVYKCLVHTAEMKNGCILTGTKAPAILTSRSDSFETKVNSIALAAVVAEAMKNK